MGGARLVLRKRWPFYSPAPTCKDSRSRASSLSTVVHRFLFYYRTFPASCISSFKIQKMKRLSQLRLPQSVAAIMTATGVPRSVVTFHVTSSIYFQLRCAGTHRRVVRPTEEGVADLIDDDDGFTHGLGAHAGASKESLALSSLVASASLYHGVVHQDNTTKGSGDADQLRSRDTLDATTEEVVGNRGEEDDAATEVEQTHTRNRKAMLTETMEEEDDIAERNGGGDRDPLLVCDNSEEQLYITQQQRVYYEMPVQKFTDIVCAYLRSTENVALVSSQEEHIVFPVLLDRLQEFHISQLLDILECHWSRSSMLRYGTTFKDAVRDRIAQLATVAATQLEKKRQQGTSISSFSDRCESGYLRGSTEKDGTLPDEDEDAIFVRDKQEQQSQQPADTSAPSSLDAILAHADKEITAATIYRALVVTGMGAGRRKRDLVFFQLLGNYFTYFINDYRDPHDLVRVLTALARAKIVPSPAFLNLLARRLPVLHKRVPLEPVPAYRAMSNFARMGHTSMNTFRFLADCMLNYMEKNIRDEKKQLRQLQKLKADATPKATHNPEKKMVEVISTTSCAETTASSSTTPAVIVPLFSPAEKFRPEVVAKERLRRICGLKPSTFTRFLYILARFNAPHQQYLRPLISPVILPMIPYFPPPSFTRLLKATQLFHSNDITLVEAYVTHVCDVLAPAGRLTRTDVLDLLQLLSHEDTPVPANLEQFLHVCRDSLKSATAVASPQQEDGGESEKKTVPTGTVTFLLRPQHMCRVIHCIGAFQRKVEIQLETLHPLAELVEDFARRLVFLMELSVISLLQVDEFLELCERYQIPDASGAVEQLAAKRRDIMRRTRTTEDGAATNVEGETVMEEEDYYGQFDVDVRDTFQKILIANDFNTYGSYRPLPGPLQVDFREELTKVSAFELLQSVDLFHRACPGALHPAPRMFLSRSLLEKVGNEGEVVVEEETNRLVIRQPRAELLTREDLQLFVELVLRTPLEAVRNAPAMWIFIKEKAERLGMNSVMDTANQRLRELQT